MNLGPHDKDEVIDARPQQPVRPDYRPDYQRPDYQRPDHQRPAYRPDNRPTYPYRPDNQPQPDNRPQQYKVAVGDGTKISCSIENQNKRTSWRRLDGQPLPSNSHLSGGDLVNCCDFSS